MKRKIVGLLLLISACLLFTAAALTERNEESEFLENRAQVVIRKIGHDLLLQAGDSTSRVLPVTRLGNNGFQLEFENQFWFKPDSLVHLVRNGLANAHLPIAYLVGVFECSQRAMTYGFEILSPASSVVPCQGRIQPLGCYKIQITFAEPIARAGSPKMYYFGSFALLGLALFVFARSGVRSASTDSHTFVQKKVVGGLEFDEKSGFLKLGDQLIQLSNKESKLLKILASNANQLVDRDTLQHEIWASEGVITSRSLDMFVSKLRKKLSDDGSVRIVNVHGRGYRLEIDG